MSNNNLAVVWSPLAIRQYLSIKEYLLLKFTSKELIQFNLILRQFEMVVQKYPDAYPKTNFKRNLRRAVLNKVVSVFYREIHDEIQIVAIYDNRQDIRTKMKKL